LRSAELQKLGLAQFPLVIGGVVPIVNIEGVTGGELRFTGTLLADIFLGKVTKWNDARIAALNPGLKLPAAAIIVAHRVEASGTTFNWTSYLAKTSAEWRDKVGEGLSVAWPVGVGGKGNDGVASFVKQTPNAIGYVEYAYAVRIKLAYGLVQNKAGKFVSPGVKTFAAAAAGADWTGAQDFQVVITDAPGEESYPIAATSFAVMYTVPKVPTRTQTALDFFRWGLRDGQKLASDLGFVPLPPRAVSQIDAYWKARFADLN
jgi:phosphate transport system substrate-binding protein